MTGRVDRSFVLLWALVPQLATAQASKLPAEATPRPTTPAASRGCEDRQLHLRWAFGEAACLFLRGNPAGQAYHQKLVKTHGKSKALSILSQKLGRAVYVILKRKETFDMQRFLKG